MQRDLTCALVIDCRALGMPTTDDMVVAAIQTAKQAARDRLSSLCGWGDEGGGDMTAGQV